MDFDKTMSFQVEREENHKAKEILKAQGASYKNLKFDSNSTVG